MKEKLERIDIKRIKDPSVVKNLGYKSLCILCHDIREEIIRETSIYGGHLGSNLGVVELTVALYRVFDFPKDKLIFDVGHQCYTHKILTGRTLKNLNSKDGVSGFIKTSESAYDCYEAGHSGTSLSAAQAFAKARDLNGEKYDVVALIGDSSIVNGLSFEALNSLSSHNNKIIIVLNDNDMSISRPVGGFGNFFRRISSARFYNRAKSNFRRQMSRNAVGRKLYSFTYRFKSEVKQLLVPTTLFDNLGFTYIGPVDGHSIKAMEKAFERAKATTKSAVVHVCTKKGKGYPYAEKDTVGYWHAVTPFNISDGTPKNLHPDEISYSHVFGDYIHDSLAEDEKRLLICPAMTKGSHLESSFHDFPNRAIDVGIAEEHALTLAGALSLNGFHPIVCIYSTFLQRAYDELSHDGARIGIDMSLLIDRSGLVGPDGDTHMGIYDVAYLKSIPGVIVTMPTNLIEGKALFRQSLEKGHGIYAIRYPHTLTKKLDAIPDISLDFLRWVNLRAPQKGGNCLIAVGPRGGELLEKCLTLPNLGLVKALFLNPIVDENIIPLLDNKKIYVYDSYGTRNGFSESVLAKLMELGYKGEVRVFSLPNSFVPHMSRNEQEVEYGVDVESVYQEISKEN